MGSPENLRECNERKARERRVGRLVLARTRGRDATYELLERVVAVTRPSADGEATR